MALSRMNTSCLAAIVVVVALSTTHVQAQASTCGPLSTINSCLNNPSYKCYWCSVNSTCSSNNTGGCITSPCNGTSLASCTTTSTCGWCNVTAAGYNSNCMYSVNASIPSGSCASNWTANSATPCASFSTMNSCFSKSSACYWCGSYCTATYSSSCVTVACYNLYQSGCSTSTSYPNCGWCASPFAGYSKCQFSDNGTQPAACYSSWTPNNAVMCATLSTINECYNMPSATCYWCGSYCTGYSTTNCSTTDTKCKKTSSQSYCVSVSDVAYSSCGWCASPITGFNKCLFTNNGSQPSACNGTWTPNPASSCYQWTTQNSCINNPNYTCYWCGGSFCTNTYNSAVGCYSNTYCQNTYQYSCTGSSSYYAACGWCAQPAPGYSSNCLYTSTGQQPSACSSGWTPNPAFSCTQMQTQNSCFNNPNYTSCYWCGTYCSSNMATYNCFSSSCNGAYSYSCTQSSSSYYGNCGWCTNPAVGTSSCLYGANGDQPSACLSGWTANTAASPVCTFYIDQYDCTMSASSCGWCNVPSSTYGNCQVGYTYIPSSCTSGWTASSNTPAPYTPYATTKVVAPVSIPAIVGPLLCCCGCIGFIIFVVLRKRRQNGGGSGGGLLSNAATPTNFGTAGAPRPPAAVGSTPSRPAPHGYYEAYPSLLPSPAQRAPPPLQRVAPFATNTTYV